MVSGLSISATKGTGPVGVVLVQEEARGQPQCRRIVGPFFDGCTEERLGLARVAGSPITLCKVQGRTDDREGPLGGCDGFPGGLGLPRPGQVPDPRSPGLWDRRAELDGLAKLYSCLLLFTGGHQDAPQ